MEQQLKSKQTFSFLQYRATEYEKRYESMQQLEWRLTFQVYAGYAAVAIATTHLHDHARHPQAVAMAGIAASLVLYLVFWYISLRVKERQEYFRAKQNLYLDRLRTMVDVPDLSVPQRKHLKHEYRWGMASQQVLSFSALAALVIYNLVRADLIP